MITTEPALPPELPPTLKRVLLHRAMRRLMAEGHPSPPQAHDQPGGIGPALLAAQPSALLQSPAFAQANQALAQAALAIHRAIARGAMTPEAGRRVAHQVLESIHHSTDLLISRSPLAALLRSAPTPGTPAQPLRYRRDPHTRQLIPQ